MTAATQGTRWLVVTVLALMTAVGSVPQAQAAFPGRNGALVVSSEGNQRCDDPPPSRVAPAAPPRIVAQIADDDGTEFGSGTECVSSQEAVWTASPGAARVGLLTRSPFEETSGLGARVSPDGRRFALWYASHAAWLGRIGTGGLRRWNHHVEDGVAWSPGGTKLAFAATDQLLVANAAGSTPSRRLVRHAGRPLSWSVLGRLLYGIERNDRTTLSTVASDGCCIRPLPIVIGRQALDVQAADWSPDGAWVAARAHPANADRPDYLVVVAADGSKQRTVARPPGPDGGAVVWSPDGRRIAFEAAGTTYTIPANARGVQPRRTWRTVVRRATLLDWQPLPTESQR